MDEFRDNPAERDSAMWRKKKIIWGIGILIVIILILFWILRTSDPSNDINAPNINEQPEFIAPSLNFNYQPPEVPPVTNTEFNIINLAKSYVESFGS
ncbi:hypothetical protein K8R42_04825 [bacterium]|nr:hypothetical protein [bacterium]